MSARIVLVRHGKSTHKHDGRWLRHDSVHEFESAYDAAGIRHDSHPARELVAATAKADVVCASDMIRAIESVERLAPGREYAVSPLIREIKLESPSWIPVPLPLDAWDTICGWQWTYRLALGLDHAFVERGVHAANWLVEHAGARRTVVAVTHGGFRRIVAKRLQLFGWKAAGSNMSFANWSAWSFSR
jgi:broad specificity phosphatase PhoE